MPVLIQSLLDAFPESAVLVREGVVAASNEKARQFLPQLVPGTPLPDCIVLPEEGESGSGVFTAGSAVYGYSCKSGPEGWMLSFRPSPRQAALKLPSDHASSRRQAVRASRAASLPPAISAASCYPVRQK